MIKRVMLAMGCVGFVSLIAGVASGCSSSADGAIDYQVSGGLSGHGDGTTLHVEPNGAVTRAKAGGGTETAMLSAAETHDLYAKVDAAAFDALAPTYHCNCNDSLVYIVTAHVDGDAHTVSADMQADVPGALQTVIDALQATAQLPLDWH